MIDISNQCNLEVLFFFVNLKLKNNFLYNHLYFVILFKIK